MWIISKDSSPSTLLWSLHHIFTTWPRPGLPFECCVTFLCKWFWLFSIHFPEKERVKIPMSLPSSRSFPVSFSMAPFHMPHFQPNNFLSIHSTLVTSCMPLSTVFLPCQNGFLSQNALLQPQSFTDQTKLLRPWKLSKNAVISRYCTLHRTGCFLKL